jgi:uncharacterized protein YcfL
MMKKASLLVLSLVILAGCTKNDPIALQPQQVDPSLAIASTVGIKLQSAFVTSEVSMNVKSGVAQTVTVKITDITNRVVSKSTSEVKAGDNILTLYTSALPSSAYRISIYDAAGNMLAITDFNKLAN